MRKLNFLVENVNLDKGTIDVGNACAKYYYIKIKTLPVSKIKITINISKANTMFVYNVQ